MDYKRIYDDAIAKFSQQEFLKEQYTEKHHIIPKYAGGSNAKSNLVRVSYRQHIFLHKILYRIYRNKADLCALLMMTNQTEEGKNLLRELAREKLLGSKWSEEMRNKIQKSWENPRRLDVIRSTQLMSAKSKANKAAKRSEDLIDKAERNAEWLDAKSNRSVYKFISPEGLIFDSPIFAAKYYGNDCKALDIENWCKRSKYGWKTDPELAKK